MPQAALCLCAHGQCLTSTQPAAWKSLTRESARRCGRLGSYGRLLRRGCPPRLRARPQHFSLECTSGWAPTARCFAWTRRCLRTFWTFTRRSTCSCRVSTSLAIRRRGLKRFFPQNRTRTLPRVSPLHRAFPHTLRSLSLDCKSGARQCGLPDGAVASCTCRHACPRAPSVRAERGIRVMPGGAREG